MSPHAYSEDQLVEQPAIGLFADARLADGVGAGRNLRYGRHAGARDQGRGGAGRTPARGAGANSTRRCRRRRFKRRRRTDPRPLGDEPGSRQPRGLSAAQGRHHGVGARPRTRRPEDRTPARGGLGNAGQQRFPARQPVDRDRPALHLPARSGRLRQWPALGGDRTQEARRAGAGRLRREPHPLQAADSGAVLEQRAAHRQQRHRQPRRLADRRLGPLGGVEAHRARGRTAPRVAGSDAARHLRPHPPARSGRELHAVFRAQGRAGQDHRPEPPVPRRQ